MLGFAGSRWTPDIASRYLSYAVAIGIKLFTLYLIIGIGNSLAGQWGVLLASPDATLNPRIYFQILGGALSYMMLAWYIPSLVSSLYSGTVALSLAELGYTGRSVAGVGAGVAVGALGAGALATGGAQAVVEAARFGNETSAARGGGFSGSVTGTVGGAGLLVAETVRATVPTLTGRRSSVAQRIAEERAARSPRLAGYGTAVEGRGPRLQASADAKAPRAHFGDCDRPTP